MTLNPGDLARVEFGPAGGVIICRSPEMRGSDSSGMLMGTDVVLVVAVGYHLTSDANIALILNGRGELGWTWLSHLVTLDKST